MDALIDLFANTQAALYEDVMQPIAFAVGLGNRLEDVFDGTGWLLVGLLQIAVMLLVIGPLQRWRPVEAVTNKRAVYTDVIYTLIHRLGLFRIVLFLSIEPVLDTLMGALRVQGVGTFHLEDLWPGVTDGPFTSFVIYLVVFDFVNYWLHRAQHQWHWWWALHAVHHSQRQMTQWTDNRNHLLDDLIGAVIWVCIAQLIGIAPTQFVAVVAITQLFENLQHANLRVTFGKWGERLWVSPRFHRLHHAIGLGHESKLKPVVSAAGEATRVGAALGGHNFGVLLPWWDVMFGTANFDMRFEPTGIRDQVEQGVDYGEGFWSQQRLGIKRLMQALGFSSAR
ncbi:fatty acid hydroxylase [Limnohabitans curvus]|uniref:Fatty acid hydroxylase n=1 Tax=Limnohabitans curvus TaxID=323423 RepID=A0A315ERA5_9BURK|nr:sterol desaturase family protein [Limnohabitans curvus]PUE58494.1 fatty acid hydroxylase [Limnohabitans curvus]